MEAGVGVNSPEFLQRKIERLKTALDEANALMDRQVTERDQARTQLESLKRENAELKRRLEAGGDGAGAVAPAAPAAEPGVEQELRARIAQLESERQQLQSARRGDDEELRARIAQLESERQQLQSA